MDPNQPTGVVAAGCSHTAEAARFAMESGGNAVDAAIAAQLVAVCILTVTFCITKR